MKKKILVIDVGGTHVKLMISRAKKRKFKSGLKLTPREVVAQIREEVEDWKFDAISIGFPAPVRDGRILDEPKHLGKGWVRFNFEKALGKPVRIVNDAALQALGSYRGRSEEHTSELQSQSNLVCRLLLETKDGRNNP